MTKIVNGQYMLAVGLSEPNTGSDLSSMACRAEKDGDGYRIYGQKYWTTFADGADAILAIRPDRAKIRQPARGL